jgi:glycosyltransferase involved in cell wall biosynthesis
MRAFMGLVEEGLEAQLVLVGDGPYLDELRGRYRRPEILFTGVLQDEELATVYASCDSLVSPSSSDVFGNAVFEAQACGLPVIVDRSCGVSEAILEARSGLAIDMPDPGALQAAMDQIVRRVGERRRMRSAAVEASKVNTWESLLNRLWQNEEPAMAVQGPPLDGAPMSSQDREVALPG